MRYQDGYKDEKRKALLKSAGAAAKRKGFAATGIDTFAAAAGVTSGALYAHFGSKGGLLDALIVSEMERSRARWARRPELDADTWMSEQVARYLTPAHVESPEGGCMLPTLAADIARAPDETRKLFENQLHLAQSEIAARLGGSDAAWQFLARIVGAMVLARAAIDPELQAEILKANANPENDSARTA